MINKFLTDPLKTPIVPVPGMGATKCFISDRYPGTIISVSKSGKSLMWGADRVTLVSGNVYDGTAKYSYETDPDAHPEEFKLRKNGRWVRAGESMRNGTGLSLDRREKYYDPDF